MSADGELGEVPAAIRAAWDPEAFARDGAAVVADLAAALTRSQTRQEPRVLPWLAPEEQAAAFPASYPEVGHGDLRAEVTRVLARSIRLHHPQVLGHQVPPPLPSAALAELVGAMLNNGMAIYEMGPAATAIERAVVGWMASTLGLPATTSGVLTSGGSLGNLTALLAARQARAGFDAWSLAGHGAPPLAVLVATEAHYSIARAVRILGWGDAGAIPVAVDRAHRMVPQALDDAAAAAAARGVRVVAVVASAGSTATGAFDPLDELAAVARARGLWLHVDGAHGAALALSPRRRHLVRGIELADSVVWDAHKMLMMPALITAVLVRSPADAAATFAQQATYLFDADRAAADDEWNLGRRTLECTKRMMAFELHAALRTHGVGLLRACVDRLCDAAGALAARVQAAPDFELALAPAANIVCYRHRPAGLAARDLDAHQRQLRQRLVERGHFYIVTTTLRGEVWLRSALMNPLVEAADLDGLLAELRALAAG